MTCFRSAMAFATILWAMLGASVAGAEDLALLNGWIDAASDTAPARVFAEGSFVAFRGAIAGGSGAPAFQLPIELRPATDVYVPVALCNGNQGRLWIRPTGEGTVQAPSGAFADAQCTTSLDGARFAPSATGFASLALVNGWQPAPFSTSPAAAALVGGVVHLKGAMGQGTSGVAFTLPVGMRPATNVYVPIGLCNARKGRLFIQPTGAVSVVAETAFSDAQCFTSLDGASFVPDATDYTTMTPVGGWVHAPFATSAAAARLDAGVVRLKGALANGTSPLLFTLPPTMRPRDPVLVPVDLCVARRGRLSIGTNGEVVVEAATAFADAQCFVSLEGVSFVPSPNGFAKLPLPYAASFPFVDGSTRSFTIDLGTLPVRPRLVVEVTPPPSHPDLQIQIEATSWLPPIGYAFLCASSVFSPPGAGIARLSIDLFACASGPTNWAGGEAEIRVRVLGFGAAGPPAALSVVVRGETRPPTGTLSQAVRPPGIRQTASLVAAKDAVLYQELASGGNGRGQFLWAARRTDSILASFARNALVAFDLDSTIPPSAVVDSAALQFQVTGILPFAGSSRIAIHRVAPDPTTPWQEGFLDAPGSEFDGVSGSASGADWTFRDRPNGPWATPGGDRITPAIFDTTVSSTGLQSFSSAALQSAVQSMVSSGTGLEGFLLQGPIQSPFSFGQAGIQIASRENASGTTPPTLVVEYFPTEVYESGEINAGTISFIDAAQNFRWIYDLDQDGVYVTPEVGICEVTDPDPFNPNLLPYTYRFQGDPGFTGVDCCTWRVGSSLGIVGTGQALFFHRLDPANPANQPPDVDLDGIRDLCDNCPNHANGPLRGTCLAGTVGATCRSNLECGTGGLCSLSQEDSNGDFVGNVCVPEPGLGGGLVGGLATLIVFARGRRPGAPRRGARRAV